jgi:hypothetical protein
MNKDLRESASVSATGRITLSTGQFYSGPVITRMNKTNLRAWQDHDHNSRQVKPGYISNETVTVRPPTTTISSVSIPGHNTSCANHMSCSLRPLHGMLQHLHSCVCWVVARQALSLHAAISRPVILTAPTLASHTYNSNWRDRVASGSAIPTHLIHPIATAMVKNYSLQTPVAESV